MGRYLERASYDWSEDSIRMINTVNQTVKKTFFYVQEVGYFKTKPPYFTEREGLDSFLIVYTLSGNGCLKYRNETYSLTAGKIFYISCMEYHYYECVLGEEWEILWVHFKGISSRGYYEIFNAYNHPILKVSNHEKFELKLYRILSLTKNRKVDSEIICAGLITELLTEILLENLEEKEALNTTPAYIKSAAKELDQRFREDISIDELSMIVGVSKYYLLRQFKRYTGKTVGEYLTANRMNYAKELLKYSDYPISEIAFLCGMHQVSYFIHIFKVHEGMTPLAFRRSWQ